MLDYHRGDRTRLHALLALPDGELIAALGGRRREELSHRHRSFLAPGPPDRRAAGAKSGSRICRHQPGYPVGLQADGSPRLLHLSSNAGRFVALTARPVVAILGAETPSEYGKAMAANLARGSALCGITVAAPLRSGIAAAAHSGVLEAGGGSIAVIGDGLKLGRPSALRALARQVGEKGCLVSELPASESGRAWGAVAAERTFAGLASLAVLVEDHEDGPSIATIALAKEAGAVIGALPGPVTSALSSAPHALLAGGERLVRGPADVAELLSLAPAGGERADGLAPPLRRVLDQLGAGCDTVEGLTGSGRTRGEVVAALAELEVLGLISRGSGGRYVAREPARSCRSTGAGWR